MMDDDQVRFLTAILWRMVMDAGGVIELGELTIDKQGVNSLVAEMDDGIVRLTALPDYVIIGEDQPAATISGSAGDIYIDGRDGSIGKVTEWKLDWTPLVNQVRSPSSGDAAKDYYDLVMKHLLKDPFPLSDKTATTKVQP